MGGCQNYDPFLGTLNIRCRIIIGIQKGTIILITTHVRKLFSPSPPTPETCNKRLDNSHRAEAQTVLESNKDLLRGNVDP